MVSCSSFGCKNRSSRPKSCRPVPEKEHKVSFHSFPKDPIRKQKWIHAIRRKDWKPSEKSVICSDHFNESDYDPRHIIRILKHNAVPSIFPTHPKHLQKKLVSRKPPMNRNIKILPTKDVNNYSEIASVSKEEEMKPDICGDIIYPSVSQSQQTSPTTEHMLLETPDICGDIINSSVSRSQQTSPYVTTTEHMSRSQQTSPCVTISECMLLKRVSSLKCTVKKLQLQKYRQKKRIASLTNKLTTIKKKLSAKKIDIADLLGKENSDLIFK